MNQEEYLAHTEIRSVAEARRLLFQVRVSFVVVFFVIFLRRFVFSGTEEGVPFLLATVVSLGVLIFFVQLCKKVIRRTREVTRANALWSVVLAPISWIWFYPDLVRPLRIISGEVLPPKTLLVEGGVEIGQKKYSWKTRVRDLGLILLGFVVLFFVYTIWVAVHLQPETIVR